MNNKEILKNVLVTVGLLTTSIVALVYFNTKLTDNSSKSGVAIAPAATIHQYVPTSSYAVTNTGAEQEDMVASSAAVAPNTPAAIKAANYPNNLVIHASSGSNASVVGGNTSSNNSIAPKSNIVQQRQQMQMGALTAVSSRKVTSDNPTQAKQAASVASPLYAVGVLPKSIGEPISAVSQSAADNAFGVSSYPDGGIMQRDLNDPTDPGDDDGPLDPLPLGDGLGVLLVMSLFYLLYFFRKRKLALRKSLTNLPIFQPKQLNKEDMKSPFMKSITSTLYISAISILLFAAQGVNAQTRIQSATGNTGNNASGTITVNLSSAPQNGNTLIAVISGQTTTQDNVTSITQVGVTWTRAVSKANSSSSNTEIWYSTSLSNASKNLTINQGSTRSAAIVMEYSGLLYASPLDRTASNSNTSNSTSASTGTTLTTTVGPELWIGGIGLRSSNYTLSAITNSFTEIGNAASTNGTASNNAKVYALEKIVTTTGAASTGGTVSSSSRWSGAIATFKVNKITFTPLFTCAESGATITLTGSGLTDATAVKFNGLNAGSFTVVNSTTITATLPTNATSGLLSVTLAGGTIASSSDILFVKGPQKATSDITKTTCPSATDGAVRPNNIPNAVNFNPTQNQYIDLGNTYLNGLTAFSIEGWVKTTSYNRNSFFGQNNAVEIGFTAAGELELWSEGLRINLFTPYPKDGEWHHVAGVGNGSNMTIFIDGIEATTLSHTALTSPTNYGISTSSTKIGGYVWDNSAPNLFSGQMLKVGFWNRALTAIEIANLAARPHAYQVGESGLIAGYNFYEGSGTTLTKTPSGTNGTFQGTPVSTWSDVFTYSWTKVSSAFTATTKNITGVGIGTYNLAASFNGCTSNSDNFVVTSTNTESTAATSITGVTPVCQGTEVTLNLVGGTLGTSGAWKWYSGACGTNPIVTGLSNGGRTLTITPTETTTYFARAEGSCVTTACVSFTVTVNINGTWLGVTSTDWNTASNWCGGVPTSTTDAIIPAVPVGPYEPTVGSAGAVCKTLNINLGRIVTMGGAYAFNIYGDLINNGTFVPSTSIFTFKSSGAVLGASTTKFHELIIDPSQTLTGSSATMNLTGNWRNNGIYAANDGIVGFIGTTSQQIHGTTTSNTTFHSLTIDNTAGVVAKDTIIVNGVLNLASASPNETNGSLEMTIDYGTYSNVLTPDSNKTTRNTEQCDILDSHILYMGATSTTIGVGDVTGKVKRTTFTNNTAYTFGSPYTSLTFNQNTTGTLPDSIMFVITKGSDRGIHANKTDAVKRLYQMIRGGGSAPTSYTMKLHYIEDELNGLDESKLVLWDHSIPYATTNTPHQHGKSAQDNTNNWIELTGHGIKYIDNNKDETIGGTTKYWLFAESLIPGNGWIGVKSSDWNEPLNWGGGHVPTCADDVIIPKASDVPFSPTLPSSAPFAKAKSIEIAPGGELSGGVGGELTICGGDSTAGGLSSWTNNGTFIPGTSTVIFNFPRTTDDETSTINGTSNFHNITIATGTYLVLQPGSSTGVSGAVTQTGNLDARTFDNTFTYNGVDAQTVVKPTIGGGYNNLVLSGAGTKTLPTSSLNISGDLTLNADVVSTSNIMVFDGIATQNLSGTSTSVLNSVTINNATGLNLNKDQTLTGTLTLTNGPINTGSSLLTVNCGGDITGQSASSYVNGKLAREYCAAGSKIYPIGKGGNYRPLTLEYTTLIGGSSTVQAEQFESGIQGTTPPYLCFQPNRYWDLEETSGYGNGEYIITLDGTPFPVEVGATANILRGDGTVNTGYAATFSSFNFTLTNNFTDNVFGNFAVASPVITTSPSNVTVCELSEDPITFTITPEPGTYTYTWEVDPGTGVWSELSDGGVYSTTTTASLTIIKPPYSMNGYKYRGKVKRICGGIGTSGTATLTVTQQPQGSLTAIENICKGTKGYLTWTSTAGTGPFTVRYNPGNVTVTNVVSGTPFSVGNISANTTFTLLSVQDANCQRTTDFTVGSASVTVNPYITWTGSVDRDWNTLGNWCGGIPTTNDNVLIPNVPNKPLISNLPLATTKSLIIESGSLVEISGVDTLDVSGNLTNNETLIIDNGTLLVVGYIENDGVIYTKTTIPLRASYGGVIEFNNQVNSQTIYGATYEDVVINNPKSVIVEAAALVTVQGTLEIKPSAQIEIHTSCAVVANTIVNNAGTEGIYIEAKAGKVNGSLIFNNSVANPVQAIVQMYSPAYTKTVPKLEYVWQFFGIPFKSLGQLGLNFQGAVIRRYNETGTGTNNADLSKRRWIQLNNSSIINPVTGYELVQPTNTTYTFRGELFNSDIDTTLSYTSTAQYPGQHILSNPYTAAINIKNIVFGENMDSTIYLYNTGSFAQWGVSPTKLGNSPGQYIAAPFNTAGDAGIPADIPSMQGFMVRTADGKTEPGSIYINYNSVKTRNTTAQRARKAPSTWLRLNLQGATADGDVMWIFSNPQTTRGNDNGWDAGKMGSLAGTPMLYSKNETGSYQINAVPDIHETDVVIRPGILDTEYTITFDNENLGNAYENVYFFDKVTQTILNITESGTIYTFTTTDQVATPRFQILTSLPNLTVTGEAEVTGNSIKVFSSNSFVYIDNRTDEVYSVEIYDQLGRFLAKYNANAGELKSIDTGFTPGVYVVRTVGTEVHNTAVIIQ